MEFWVVLSIVVLLFLSFYLLMQRSISKIILGLLVLSNAGNLLVFVGPGLTRGHPPFIVGESLAGFPHADPLPQALILTAIVIGMGVLAFTLGLVLRTVKNLSLEDVDDLRSE